MDRLGFVYSQTTDRLWRKNRQTTSGSSCLGHDINRNWPYMWNVPGGASTDPCAEDFKGKQTTSFLAIQGGLRTSEIVYNEPRLVLRRSIFTSRSTFILRRSLPHEDFQAYRHHIRFLPNCKSLIRPRCHVLTLSSLYRTRPRRRPRKQSPFRLYQQTRRCPRRLAAIHRLPLLLAALYDP